MPHHFFNCAQPSTYGQGPPTERLHMHISHPIQGLKLQRQALNENIRLLQSGVSERVTTLKKDLKTITNRCMAYDEANKSELAPLRARVETLTQRVDSAKSFQENQCLRLKKNTSGSSRIVAFESKSAFKRLLGIGNAGREKQAQALAQELNIRGTRVTQGDIKNALKSATTEMTKQVELKLPLLIKEMEAVLNKAGIANSAGIAEDMIEEMRGHLNLKNSFNLKESFQPVSSALTKQVAAKLKAETAQKTAPLRAELEKIDSKIRTLDQIKREQELASRREIVVKAGIDPSTAASLDADLKKLQNETTFGTIYHTNAGCRAINGMFDRTAAKVSGSAVINEIERVHGEDIFAGGAQKGKQEIKSGALQLTPAILNEISDKAHKLGCAEYALGKRGLQTTFRRAEHSAQMIETLQKMAGTSRLIHPTRFMSTADAAGDTAGHPMKPGHGDIVNFEVRGVSWMKTGSRWRMGGEGQVRLYSPQSCFQVMSAQKDRSGVWQVKLAEVVVSDAHRKNAEALTY